MTIAGSGAGGVSAILHYLSPQSKGLVFGLPTYFTYLLTVNSLTSQFLGQGIFCELGIRKLGV